VSIALKPKSLNQAKRKKWWLAALVLIAIMGIGSVAYRQMILVPQQKARNQVQTALVERKNLTITISANGTVQPERSVNVSPKNSGILKQLLVKEGDLVEKGQILAYMDDSNLQGQLRQSQGNLAAAEANWEKLVHGNRSEEIETAKAQLAEQKANLQQLRNGNRLQDVAQAQGKLKDTQYALQQADDDLKRNQSLYTEGAISLQSLNTFRTTRDRAQTQVQQAEQAVSLMRSGTRPEEITQAQAQVTAAQGAVQIIQTNLNDMVIRAPFSGVIARKFADPGAFVTPTTAGSAVTSASSSSILALASTNEIVAQVAEANIAQIRKGLTATIQVDAYPGKLLTGKVTQIATQSVVVQNVTSFEVKTSVSDTQHLLRSGMNVNVAFNAGELKNVLVVPTGSIVQQDNAQGVFVAKEKGDPVFVPIVVGTTVNDKTEVKSGLVGTESVLLSFPPGTRQTSKLNGRP
jgi:HlyD family secretion protein